MLDIRSTKRYQYLLVSRFPVFRFLISKLFQDWQLEVRLDPPNSAQLASYLAPQAPPPSASIVIVIVLIFIVI